ncbi:MAG: DUF2868 domain-containing protein [Deltaproteobacteria bacterium]|nr:DUF2868 domain-containing protein [Deltaproteobacteria bacterium]
MKLYEIINLEYRLYKDTQSDPVEIRKRDREIGQGFTGIENDRASLFRYWLKQLEDEKSHLGQSVVSALTFLRYLVFFFFIISGATVCAGVLSYDGTIPVNIVNFIAVFLGFQILLYLLFLLNLLPAPVRGKIPFIGDFYRFAGFIFYRTIVAISNHLYKNRTESIRNVTGIFNRVKSRHLIYKRIERLAVFSITQLGGFAFSLGALASCAYLIIFSDLAFAWNTTLDISPEFFHRIVKVISSPWALFSSDLVPTIDLVESTRYFRLDGSYSGIHSSALTAGGWWPFLLCILIFYGLIPRLILLVFSRLALVHAQKQVPFLSADLDSLYRRLTSPVFSSQTENPEHRVSIPDKHELKIPDEHLLKSEACSLIVWGEIDLPETEIVRIVRETIHWNIVEVLYAGMLDNLQDEKTLKHFENSRGDEPVLLLAESWEAPGKAVLHFLSCLRSNINRNRKIVIGLINLDSEKKPVTPALTDWQNWQDTIVKLNDPFIGIEPVTGVSK